MVNGERRFVIGLAGLACLVLVWFSLASCGGGGGGGGGRPAGTVGAAGGTVALGGGVTVVVPPGALSQDVQLAVTVSDGRTLTFPGYSVVSSLYTFAPDRTTFAKPVTVTLPRPAAAPADATLLWSRLGDGSTFEDAQATVSASSLSANVTHFSGAIVVKGLGNPPLLTVAPKTAHLVAGQGSQTFSATPPPGSSVSNVGWQLSPASGAGTITQAGLSAVYSPPSTIGQSTIVTLQASAQLGNLALSDTATITVDVPATLTVGDYCAQLVEVLARQETCTFATSAAIQALRTTLASNCSDMTKAVAGGRAVFDPAEAATCISALNAATCEQLFIDLGGAPSSPPSCARAVTGTEAAGASCRTSFDCSNGTCSSDLSCPGACQSWLVLGEGCGSGSAECGPGLVCELNLVRYECRAVSIAGGPCPCGTGTVCDASTNTCRPWKTSGSCNPAAETSECAPTYRCVNSTCQALVGLGAGCVPPAASNPFDMTCGTGLFCDGTSRTCVAWPVIGESCAVWPICQSGYCDSTKKLCAADKPDGATCTLSVECQSQNCSASRCAPSSVCHEP